MKRWIRSLIAVIRDIPRQTAFELEQRRWESAADARWKILGESATWRCPLHDDVIRVRNGPWYGFLARRGTLIVPMDQRDVEAFHGFDYVRDHES